MDGYFRRGMAALNLMNVCIDEREAAGSHGRLYCRYQREPQKFENEYQLLKMMEELMDRIDYPQSSVEMRCYGKKTAVPIKQEEPCMTPEEVAEPVGECATFLVYVQYRQNATWQGEVFWQERRQLQTFRSALELLKLLDSAR